MHLQLAPRLHCVHKPFLARKVCKKRAHSLSSCPWQSPKKRGKRGSSMALVFLHPEDQIILIHSLRASTSPRRGNVRSRNIFLSPSRVCNSERKKKETFFARSVTFLKGGNRKEKRTAQQLRKKEGRPFTIDSSP